VGGASVDESGDWAWICTAPMSDMIATNNMTDIIVARLITV
jgi:hypothetical protein